MVRQQRSYRFGKFIYEYLFLDNRRKNKKTPNDTGNLRESRAKSFGPVLQLHDAWLLLQYGRKKALAQRTT
jgi:hypothetical protein